MSDNRRVALITGANQGIGFAVAQALAADGMQIVVNGRRAVAVAEAARKLCEGGAQAHGIAADVAAEHAVMRMFEEIESRFGRLDVVVNNAGVAPRRAGRSARVEDTPLDDWQRAIAVNLTGAFLVSRAAIAIMKRNSRGRIINMASQSGRMYRVRQRRLCGVEGRLDRILARPRRRGRRIRHYGELRVAGPHQDCDGGELRR